MSMDSLTFVEERLLFEGWTVVRFWCKEITKNVDEWVKVIEGLVFDILTNIVA